MTTLPVPDELPSTAPVAVPGHARTVGEASGDLVVLADDLSGACEVGGLLLERGTAAVVRLAGGSVAVDPAGPGHALVVDLDHRDLPADQARRVVSTMLHRLQELGPARSTASGPLLVKVDSLWRGSIAATVDALLDNGFGVIVAGALPALRRSVVAGVPYVDGTALARTDAWALEPRPAPGAVAELLDNPSDLVGLAVVRGADLVARLDEILGAGGVAVVDGETDDDLRCTVHAAARLRRGPVALLGSAALVAATVDVRGVAAPAAPRPPSAPGAVGTPDVLVVVGTGSGAAVAQIAQLAQRYPDLIRRRLGPGTRVDDGSLEPTPSVLSLTGDHPGPDAADAVLTTAAAAVAGTRDLVLTGGRTARSVLTRLGITSLEPLVPVAHGAVVGRASDGRLVATKPGSFGGPGILADLVTVLTALAAPPGSDPGTPSTTPIVPTPDHPRRARPGGAMSTPAPTTAAPTTDVDLRPVIAVTMGDAAGVGPEVTVGALLDAAAYRDGRPIVVGDAERLRQGARALGVEVEVVEITEVDQAVFTAGRINVVDPHLVPADLPWGEISPVAGHAAHEYIRIACELAMSGAVQAICTAPLNKAALHAAGHVFPGHTELLAHFTGVEEVSMMLTTPKIKVIHVTTHIGLIDAVARIEPGLVERTIRRGHEALVRAGNPAPRIGVCAINPHAGENGLFGYGEEAAKVTPGIEAARAAGVDAVGPLPADTAFFLGGRGDYDLIVAMYHDQGHGPVKVLGIEAGVNITVGLPVIRTSVDHGTAFDIAGTGKVEVGSMIEALRQAGELASAPVPTR